MKNQNKRQAALTNKGDKQDKEILIELVKIELVI